MPTAARTLVRNSSPLVSPLNDEVGNEVVGERTRAIVGVFRRTEHHDHAGLRAPASVVHASWSARLRGTCGRTGTVAAGWRDPAGGGLAAPLDWLGGFRRDSGDQEGAVSQLRCENDQRSRVYLGDGAEPDTSRSRQLDLHR